MKFYIFRHGQTDWNKERRIQGHSNIPLNRLGESQAETLKSKLLKLDIEVIFSSDLDRAFNTARIGANGLDIEIIKDHRLREAHFGDAEGMLVSEIKKHFGEDRWERFMKLDPNHLDISFPNGESRIDSINRMRSAIDEIKKQNKYKRVGISTHGGVVRNLLSSYLIENKVAGSFDIPIPNCVVYELDLSGDKAVIRGPIE